ncbi:PEGA domain-containing protein [Phenylobacterium sp. 20VBR1]|uniref:PEGA domain-containing protein n=1 Tax=Phenylobacterium glaciei TaxID=2803784 RepID=A0A941D203_9CAUL|nr:PEGA domain-containing protein [Phenylobacterium glaciei]MBR7620810.1 PEGA domain-containing protein [Phenylobacterium glaciei]
MSNLSNALRAAAIVCVALSSTACATVTRGSTEAWTVETDPIGAKVSTTAGFACDATPCTFKMPRKSEFTVTLTKPGYKTVTTQVVHEISGAGGAGMAGNVILGGVIGAGVDLATGAMMDLKPNPLVVKMERQ